jgi:uncharacterized membrane protein YebE (DUF533 family)
MGAVESIGVLAAVSVLGYFGWRIYSKRKQRTEGAGSGGGGGSGPFDRPNKH